MLRINSLVILSFLFITLFHCVFVSAHHGMDHDWSYKNADHWAHRYPDCGGQRQSPINIETSQLEESKYAEKPMQFINYGETPTSSKLTNIGHSIMLTFEFGDKKPSIAGGPLNGEYYAASMFFHWNRNSNNGSEHTINGEKYAMEGHVIHIKTEYGNYQEAMKHEDGIVVHTLLFTDQKTNPDATETQGVNEVIDAIDSIRNHGDEKVLNPFPLTKFRYRHRGEPSDYPFRVYNGSMALPPCTENVIYVISTFPYYINPEQLQKIQSLELPNNDSHNNRPVQPLNGRTVYSVPAPPFNPKVTQV